MDFRATMRMRRILRAFSLTLETFLLAYLFCYIFLRPLSGVLADSAKTMKYSFHAFTAFAERFFYNLCLFCLVLGPTATTTYMLYSGVVHAFKLSFAILWGVCCFLKNIYQWHNGRIPLANVFPVARGPFGLRGMPRGEAIIMMAHGRSSPGGDGWWVPRD